MFFGRFPRGCYLADLNKKSFIYRANLQKQVGGVVGGVGSNLLHWLCQHRQPTPPRIKLKPNCRGKHTQESWKLKGLKQ